MRVLRLVPTLALAFLLGGLAVGCASTNTEVGSQAAATADRNPDRVDAEDLEGRAIARVEEMLRGQVAGVSVSESGGNLVIRIRGTSTLTGNSEPLFVVDGLPLQQGTRGILDGISPMDVESIEVLKSAAETAMYGTRGANGVVLIRTKRTIAPTDISTGDSELVHD
ncbi:MAG: TonB-dependent receptor plug domain-containing protein [Bacteroidota bacterium]